ncbi:intradiol ring-cleavage dioxygenase [Nonomuraea sp. LPB2021202275-12-8]|uniref:intradiol ring-cleavage dioxygenase n=1 Tax=Nonomuraea sp. LPB2021202275-12-8 TaxID=3120159 RepID=UPI00300CEE1D
MGHDHEGQRVSRRTLLAGVSSIGLGSLLTACQNTQPVTTSTGAAVTPRATTTGDLTSLFADAGTCTLTPAATQGPYYFDADKIRSDIREDKQGVRLRVAVRVQDSETCRPLGDAVVEIWHCDAGGLYSGAESQSTGGAGSPPGPDGELTPTDDERYLRGAQVTNSDGIVQFTTIWPGWYRGRTVHIHAMVHFGDARVLTTQVMFDEALNAQVLARSPYAARSGRDTRNDDDGIYREEMLLKVTEEDDGYLGAIVFAADSDRDGG